MRKAWGECPEGCNPIITKDLNICFGFPLDEREESIVDLLDEINLVDSSCKFRLCTLHRYAEHIRWTWSRKWGNTRHYSQPDYKLARNGDTHNMKGIGF